MYISQNWIEFVWGKIYRRPDTPIFGGKNHRFMPKISEINPFIFLIESE